MPPTDAPMADVLSVARRVKGFMPDDEGLALGRAAGVAVASHPGPIVEVGSYCGRSTVYLGAAAAPAGRLVFAVDHHRGSEENQAGWEHHDPEVVDAVTGRIDTLPFFRRTIEDAALEATVVAVVGHSPAVASVWATSAALVFIDGGHGDEPAWADYRGWVPHVGAGGLLAIHDVFPDPADGGRPPYELYRRAVDEDGFVEDAGLGCGSLRVLRRPG